MIDDGLLELLEKEAIEQFDAERQQMRLEVKQQIMQAQQRYKQNFYKKRKDYIDYKVDDLVAIKRTQFATGRKLASEFLGPYEVVKIKRNQRYDVKKVAAFDDPNYTSTSVDYMKPWRSAEN